MAQDPIPPKRRMTREEYERTDPNPHKFSMDEKAFWASMETKNPVVFTPDAQKRLAEKLAAYENQASSLRNAIHTTQLRDKASALGEQHAGAGNDAFKLLEKHESFLTIAKKISRDGNEMEEELTKLQKHHHFPSVRDADEIEKQLHGRLENMEKAIKEAHKPIQSFANETNKGAAVAEKQPGFLSRIFNKDVFANHEAWLESLSPGKRKGLAVTSVTVGAIVSIIGTDYLWRAISGVKQDVKKVQDTEGNTHVFTEQKAVSPTNRVISAAAGGLTTAAGWGLIQKGFSLFQR